MIKKLFILCVILITCTSCSEFALLASGASIAGSQNGYVKLYNGVDVLTIMQTDKDIKRHMYDQIRRFDKAKKKEID
jgi:hypothetical protein